MRARRRTVAVARLVALTPLRTLGAATLMSAGCHLDLDRFPTLPEAGQASDEASGAPGSDDSGAGPGDGNGLQTSQGRGPDDGAPFDDRAIADGGSGSTARDAGGDSRMANPPGADSSVANSSGVDSSVGQADASVGGACAFDSDCPVDIPGCKASLCNAGVCTAPNTYASLLVSQFSIAGVPAVIKATGLHKSSAMAAAYPYLFVDTSAGVVGYDVTSPLATKPRTIAINYAVPPKNIVAAVAVGTIVYLVETVTTGYQTIHWFDVVADASTTPTSGRVTSFNAHAAFQAFLAPPLNERPTMIDVLFNVVPGYGVVNTSASGLFLVYHSSDHTTYYPTAYSAKPDSSVMLVPYWNQALVTGADLVTSSGSRLVAYNNDSMQPKFSIVANPGTAADVVGAQITVPTPSDVQAAFASEPGGGVLWTSAILSPTNTAAVAARLTLLLANAKSTLAGISTPAQTAYVDIEHYVGTPLSPPLVAPPVWVDGTALALGLAADHANLANTAVHVISTGAAGISAANGFLSLPSLASTAETRSSNTFAYVLTSDASSPTVYVLAPACAK